MSASDEQALDPSLRPAPPSAAGASSASSTSRSQRILACVLCQQRKVKCDRHFPCANCKKQNVQCVPATQARRRRRRFPERDLLERIRRYEGLLKQNHVKFEPMHGDIDSVPHIGSHEKDSPEGGDDSDEGHGDHDRSVADASSPATSTASRARSTQQPKNFWQAMSQGLRDPMDDKSTESNGGSLFSRTWDCSYSNDNLLLGYRDAAVDLATFHPEPVHIFRLWQLYIDNVNPLLKVTHTPSLQGRIIEAAASTANLSTTNSNLEALMFAIYCMATLSLTAEECEAKFGMPQQDLMTKYHFGCQQALLNCNFLQTLDRNCLTAYFLYLLSVSQQNNPRSLCSMLGVAIRTAERMGCHDETSLSRFSILEAEMRRRLWWSLMLFDSRVSQLAEHVSTVLVPTWDCKVPLNVNDADLRDEMKTRPASSTTQASEAIFTCTRSEIGDYSRHSPYLLDFTNPAYKAMARPLPENGSSAALGRFIEDRYLRLCDPEVPLHFMTLWLTRSALAKDRLMEHYARFFQPSEQPSDAERDDALTQATRLLDADTRILSNPHTSGYLWVMRIYFPFPGYIHIVRELKLQPLGERADQLWEIMAQNYDARLCNVRVPDRAPFLRYTSVLCQAWEVREEAQKQAGQEPQEPRIISAIKQRLAESSSQSEGMGSGSIGSSDTGQLSQGMDVGTGGDYNLSTLPAPAFGPGANGGAGGGLGYGMDGTAPTTFPGSDPTLFSGLPAQAPMAPMNPFTFSSMYWGFGGRRGW